MEQHKTGNSKRNDKVEVIPDQIVFVVTATVNTEHNSNQCADETKHETLTHINKVPNGGWHQLQDTHKNSFHTVRAYVKISSYRRYVGR